MAGTNTVRNFLVGIMFLGSLAVLGVSTYAVQALPFLDSEDLVEVRFPEIDNLQIGDDVLVHGFRVGLVDSIRYDPNTERPPIVVTCSLKEKVHLTTKTTFTIHDAGPLGGRYIAIAPGEGEPTEADHDGFVGRAPGGLFRQLENLIEQNEATVTEILDTIRSIVRRIDAGEGLVGSAINDADLRDSFAAGIEEIKDGFAEIRETFRAINEGDGALGAIVTDTAVRDRVTAAIYDISDVIANLKEERGVVGLLLHNEKAKNDLAATLDHLQETARSIREGDGLIARLVQDEALANRVAETIDDFHEIVHKANSGEGTLGQVINNPRAWDELVKILVLARETIEDLREQAPVSTFVNAIFAAF